MLRGPRSEIHAKYTALAKARCRRELYNPNPNIHVPEKKTPRVINAKNPYARTRTRGTIARPDTRSLTEKPGPGKPKANSRPRGTLLRQKP